MTSPLRERVAKRFLVIPGGVRSANDGQYHYIDAEKLMRLYGVNREECIIMPLDTHGWWPQPGLTVLEPRYDGNYTAALARLTGGTE